MHVTALPVPVVPNLRLTTGLIELIMVTALRMDEYCRPLEVEKPAQLNVIPLAPVPSVSYDGDSPAGIGAVMPTPRWLNCYDIY